MSWPDSAACRGKPQLIFFPASSGSAYQRHNHGTDLYAAARAICASYPVRAECLDDALAMARAGRQVDGMWGGLDEHERQAVRRRQERRES